MKTKEKNETLKVKETGSQKYIRLANIVGEPKLTNPYNSETLNEMVDALNTEVDIAGSILCDAYKDYLIEIGLTEKLAEDYIILAGLFKDKKALLNELEDAKWFLIGELWNSHLNEEALKENRAISVN